MLPLAVLMHERGHKVYGSDRSRDQGKTPEKFKSLEELGIQLFPQDGSGVTENISRLVVSSAIEPTIPDVQEALFKGITIIKRGALLAECFNQAKISIAIAGTSGKSTVTGMVGTILLEMGLNPTIVNGGEIRNLESRFSGVHVGNSNLFVAEMDESDGSIAYYKPTIGILNNIAHDHKSMEELEQLFGTYLQRTKNYVVVNQDFQNISNLLNKSQPKAKTLTYGILRDAQIQAKALKALQDGISFLIESDKSSYPIHLKVPGAHNVSNGLAALCVAKLLKLDLVKSCAALEKFQGIHRRLETIGTKNGITVIDDFGHNPDKIAATLSTLKAFDGRLIVMFQPHGFGPLKLMGKEMVEVFTRYLSHEDILLMPEAYYAGGTVDRSVTAQHLINDLKEKNIDAHWFEKRDQIPAFIQANAKKGDRVVIMGARDDTLHTFAQDILKLF